MESFPTVKFRKKNENYYLQYLVTPYNLKLALYLFLFPLHSDPFFDFKNFNSFKFCLAKNMLFWTTTFIFKSSFSWKCKKELIDNEKTEIITYFASFLSIFDIWILFCLLIVYFLMSFQWWSLLLVWKWVLLKLWIYHEWIYCMNNQILTKMIVILLFKKSWNKFIIMNFTIGQDFVDLQFSNDMPFVWTQFPIPYFFQASGSSLTEIYTIALLELNY